ncbi:hypothetical protein GCM10009555_027530 [Acrocarpospora macrocephala]|uniref:Uncharacterized protein n=1 Tax=Acrocarpospora macrocephala TaxID=150177 RepID=A0A5M3X3B7_9ACTN|nr:hypothetical protein [Acrocarpospora macrocephala]GES15540.1 hypothetical protein Amac_091370 [Acrocarpospora macrocephala]
MTPRKRRPAVRQDRWSDSRLAELGLTPVQQKILLGLGGVAALLVVGLLLTLVVQGVNGTAAGPSQLSAGSSIGQARPSEYQSWPSLKQFAPIADRNADAKPLTAEEVFATRTLKSGKQTLKLAQRQLDNSCASVLWGDELIEQVAAAGCTQAVRGLYTTTVTTSANPTATPSGTTTEPTETTGSPRATTRTTYIAQYTLLNLRDAEAANTLVTTLEALHRGGWTLPLKPDQAPFQGYSESSGHAMGHYVGLVWVARSDGADPESTDDFVTLSLTLREAEKAIYRRVVTATGGTPPATP